YSRRLDRNKETSMLSPINRREFMQRIAGSLALASVIPEAPESTEPQARRRALIIAVHDYYRPELRDQTARDLNSMADAAKLEAVLRDTLKFNEVVVRSTREQTTRAAIEGALKKFLADIQEGDILFFHFSGHGSQVRDPDDKQFGYDQTLVP